MVHMVTLKLGAFYHNLKKNTDTTNNGHQRRCQSLCRRRVNWALTPCKVIDSETNSDRFSCLQRSHSEPRRGSKPSVLANGSGRRQALPKCWVGARSCCPTALASNCETACLSAAWDAPAGGGANARARGTGLASGKGAGLPAARGGPTSGRKYGATWHWLGREGLRCGGRRRVEDGRPSAFVAPPPATTSREKRTRRQGSGAGGGGGAGGGAASGGSAVARRRRRRLGEGRAG